MTYTKKQFLEDVKKEAVVLKKHATKEELYRLDFSRLRYDEPISCIYGLVTGFCRNERAVELIGKCCTRFFHNDALGKIARSDDNTEAEKVISEFVNGPVSEKPRSMDFVSSIETYIYLKDAKRENLIDFLKGTRKDLVL